MKMNLVLKVNNEKSILIIVIVVFIIYISVINFSISNNVELESYENNSVTNIVSSNDNIEYLNDEMFVILDNTINKDIKNFTTNYFIENIQENYAIERHFFILEGTGNNDRWGNIRINWNFEYPKIRYTDNKEKEDKINSFIADVFLFFVLDGSESKNYISYDPFKGYSNTQSSKYEITYVDDNYISIHYTTYFTEGFGMGIAENSGFVIDSSNGKVLKLYDLIRKEDIIKYIQENQYELVSEVNGIGNISNYDEIVKNELIGYLEVNTKVFEQCDNFAKPLFYLDDSYIYLSIHELPTYGRDILLKIPFEMSL